MKFKYMLRGLGIGIIITAAVMGAYSRNAVVDARVAVLKEYGLGEEAVLVEETETATESVEDTADEPTIVRNEELESEISSVLDEAKEAEQTESILQQPSTVEMQQSVTAEETMVTEPAEVTMVTEPAEETVVTEPIEETVSSDDAIQIVIAKGDDSGTVSRKLYNAGLIENAAEYDAFLMQHGYDKRISTGTKTIYPTDTWQEIAEKLIGN